MQLAIIMNCVYVGKVNGGYNTLEKFGHWDGGTLRGGGYNPTKILRSETVAHSVSTNPRGSAAWKVAKHVVKHYLKKLVY